MIRNAKILGLAIVAVLAMTAVMASAASAAQFTAAKYPVSLSGTQSVGHKFTVGGSSVTCSTATFSGTGTAASETQTINPTYSNCTAFGFINSTVTGFSSTGCDYKFYAGGTVDLVCASGKDVVIDAGPCTVTLQGGTFNDALGTNTFTNGVPSANQVTVDTNVSGVHAVVTSGFGCPVAGGTYANATYTGQTVLTGTNEGKEVKIDIG